MDTTKSKLYSLEMFDDDEPEFVNSIVEMFVVNTPDSITAIKKAFADDNMEELRQFSHKLKPHFTFFGISHIQRALQMIEDIARGNGDKENLSDLIEYVEKNSIPVIDQMKTDFPS